MDEYIRHKRTFAFFRWLLAPFLRRKFNYSHDSLAEVEGPYLLLANHNTDYDPLLIGIAAVRQLYFVASEHVTRAGIYSKLLMRYFKPIIHTKGKGGAQSSMEMLRTLRKGRSVCLFPEGNRSFNGLTCPINPSVGKLARRSGVKLITFRLRGGYFTQPRWGHGLRRGEMEGRIANIYTAEQLKAMTDAQVYEAICRDLYEDAYAAQKQHSVDFTGKNTAVGMETALFSCPECGAVSSLSTAGSTLSCSACGFSAQYLSNGLLRFHDGTECSITELDGLQRQRLREAVRAAQPDGSLFCDEVTLLRIGADHRVIESCKGLLSASPEGFSFHGKLFRPSDLFSAAIYGRNSIIVHVGPDAVHYEIKGEVSFNALKYLYLLQILNDREEY